MVWLKSGLDQKWRLNHCQNCTLMGAEWNIRWWSEWRLDDGLYFREEAFMMSFIILQNWIFRSFKKDAESFLRVWFCIFFLYKNKICVFSFVLSKNCITFASCFWFLPGNLIRDDGKSCWAVSKSYRLNAAKSSRTRNILNRSDEKVHYRS